MKRGSGKPHQTAAISALLQALPKYSDLAG